MALAPKPVMEGGFLTITIARQPGATHMVQTAATPSATAYNSVITAVVIDNPTTLKVRDLYSTSSATRRFMRVVVRSRP